MNINSAIGEIIDRTNESFNSIVVRIECPLTTGIRASCKLITTNGEKSIPLVCGSRPFFVFIKSEKERSKNKFNIAEITIQPSGAWTVTYSYDSVLQKHAEEMTNYTSKDVIN